VQAFILVIRLLLVVFVFLRCYAAVFGSVTEVPTQSSESHLQRSAVDVSGPPIGPIAKMGSTGGSDTLLKTLTYTAAVAGNPARL
jgi:hypothetical protein